MHVLAVELLPLHCKPLPSLPQGQSCALSGPAPRRAKESLGSGRREPGARCFLPASCFSERHPSNGTSPWQQLLVPFVVFFTRPETTLISPA